MVKPNPPQSGLLSRVELNHDRTERLANAGTRRAAERWLAKLGTELCTVWFLMPSGGFVEEKHVEDHETFLGTVEISLVRHSARYALWDQGGSWALLDEHTGDTRTYPNREAAEMVAIHSG